MANVEAAKNLKRPGNLLELHTYVSYMKDKSGISGWQEQQHLLEVRFVNYLPVLSAPRSKTNIFFKVTVIHVHFLQHCHNHCKIRTCLFNNCNNKIIVGHFRVCCNKIVGQVVGKIVLYSCFYFNIYYII